MRTLSSMQTSFSSSWRKKDCELWLDRGATPEKSRALQSGSQWWGDIIQGQKVFALEEMFGMVSRYLVSMVVTCRPRTLSTWDINIEVPPELYWNHHATEKRPYQYNKLLQEKSLSLFYARLYWAFLDTSLFTIKYPGLTHLAYS